MYGYGGFVSDVGRIWVFALPKPRDGSCSSQLSQPQLCQMSGSGHTSAESGHSRREAITRVRREEEEEGDDRVTR